MHLGKRLGACRRHLGKHLGKLLEACKIHLGKLLGKLCSGAECSVLQVLRPALAPETSLSETASDHDLMKMDSVQ